MTGDATLVCLVHVTTAPQTLWFLQGQVGYLKRQGVEVVALSSPGELLDRFAAQEQIRVHGLEMARRITPLRDVIATVRLWRWLREVRPDVVDAHTPKGGLLGMLGARLAGVPVRIYHMHGLPFMTANGVKRRLLRWAEKISCLLAHQVFCVSASLRDAAVAEGLCAPAKMAVVHHGSINGVAAETSFNPARFGEAARAASRAAHGIPCDARVVGYVGRVVRDKGLVELIEAWQVLRAEFPELHLLVVGTAEPQDPLPPETDRLMRTDARVHLTGFVWDTASLYSAMDLVALPTYREGFGLVAIEAAAMGLPVVATLVPGCVDAVQDGVTGTLVPSRDAPALAGAIRRYLRDPELRRRHGRAGRARAVQDFGQQAIWEALYAEYARLLSRLDRTAARPKRVH